MRSQTYQLDEAERRFLLRALEEFQGCPSSNGLAQGVYDTVDHVVLMLESSTALTIDYMSEEEETFCDNCAALLTSDAYSSYACSELCEEAILERKHEAEEAGREV